MNKLTMASIILLIPTIATAFQTPGDRISSSLSRIADIQQELKLLRDEAKDNRDAIRFTCLDDKLKLVSVALAQLLNRKSTQSSHDTESAEHEALVSEEILKKVTRSREEALLCSGADLASDGDSQVSMQLDGDMPSDNTVSFPTPPQVTEPPNCASCFR